jgi:hypothetical protein
MTILTRCPSFLAGALVEMDRSEPILSLSEAQSSPRTRPRAPFLADVARLSASMRCFERRERRRF